MRRFSLIYACLIASISFVLGRESNQISSFNLLVSEFEFFLTQYNSAVLTIVGWIAVFFANNYLQEKRIHKDKINSARSDVVRSLREYRKYLAEIACDALIYNTFFEDGSEVPNDCLGSLIKQSEKESLEVAYGVTISMIMTAYFLD